MSGDSLLAVACVSAACGGAALRYGWSLPRRSSLWNGVGWGCYGLAGITGWLASGAWGVAIAALVAMAVIVPILTHSALTSPPASEAKASNRRVNMLPEHGEPLRFGRRIATFLMVAIAALFVSIGLGIAARALLLALNVTEANASVASFSTMPLAWTILAYVLLMQDGRAAQWKVLALWAAPGLVTLAAGLAS